MNKNLQKNDLMINTLLIKQIKLLPSPLQLRNQQKAPLTASDKRKRFISSSITQKIHSIGNFDQKDAKTVIISKKNSEIRKENEEKEEKSSKIVINTLEAFEENRDKNFRNFPENCEKISDCEKNSALLTVNCEKNQGNSGNCDKNSAFLQGNSDKNSVFFGGNGDNSLAFIADFEEKFPMKISLKKSMKSSLFMNKTHGEDPEEEIYGQKPDFDDVPIEKMEKRINEFLDSENIVLRDPLEKKDEFYQRKKNLVIKSSHVSNNSSPGKGEEFTADCNSPSLNLSVNSGLLMKRKMKSTTVVLEARPEKILSKFSQN